MTSDPAALTVYGVTLGVHVVTAVVSFGMIGLSGLYAARCRHIRTDEDRQDVRRFFGPPNRVGRTLWAVPVAGGTALWQHDGAGALGQAWVIAAFAAWSAATALAVSVVWPAERRLRPIVTAPGPSALTIPAAPPGSELDRLCRRIERAAACCDVAFVVALVLMLFRPGR